ncbi:RNA polymerase sigma factor [Streptomyces lavendulocolor]|uniref:RNA polymerase sigma factor n=1 Tax=Streptomyces lavendulocolor TaxID=67316 RepID=UPI0033EAECB8
MKFFRFYALLDSGVVLSSPAVYDPPPINSLPTRNSILRDYSDQDLTEIARRGSSEAFAVLFERHQASAARLAYFYAKDAYAAQDLVAEAFFRVLQALKSGGGPAASFRGYLLTVLRNVVTEWGKSSERQVTVPDVGVYEVENAASAGSEAIRGYEYSLVLEALQSLSDRWRTVLWHTVIQGQQPSAIAEYLGISPNSVAALAYRAKEGLRQAYLTVHLNHNNTTNRCAYFVARFAAYSRGRLGQCGAEEVRQHLNVCRNCHSLHREIEELNALIRS